MELQISKKDNGYMVDEWPFEGSGPDDRFQEVVFEDTEKFDQEDIESTYKMLVWVRDYFCSYSKYNKYRIDIKIIEQETNKEAKLN